MSSTYDEPAPANIGVFARCDAAVALTPRLSDAPDIAWAFDEARQIARSDPRPETRHSRLPWYRGPWPAWGVAGALALMLTLSLLPRAPEPRSSASPDTRVASVTIAPIVISTELLRSLSEVEPVVLLGNQQPVDSRSLAVLPFTDADPATRREALGFSADSIYDQVVDQLTSLPGIYLIDPATAAVYSNIGLPAEDIAQQLGVRGVVEGRIASINGSIRFELSFTDAAVNGSSVSEAIVRPTEELAMLQAEIASTIVDALTMNPRPL